MNGNSDERNSERGAGADANIGLVLSKSIIRRHNMEMWKVRHLSKIYGKEDAAVRALDDVSFSVNKGDVS